MAVPRTRTIIASPLGRRILGLFLACTLLPCVIYGLYSDRQLRENLLRQERGRLQNEARAAGQRLHDRLLAIGGSIRTWTEQWGEAERSGARPLANRSIPLDLRSAWVQDRLAVLEWRDHVRRLPVNFDAEQWRWLEQGETLLAVEPALPGVGGILHWCRALPGEGLPRVLVVEQEIDTVLAEELEHYSDEFLVIEHGGEPIVDSGANLSSGWGGSFEDVAPGSDPLPQRSEADEWVGASWTLALRHAYGCGPMTVSVAAPRDAILAPLRPILRTYVLIACLIVVLVLLLSVRQVQRILVPLQQLCRGTARLAEGELSGRIRIETGDEFEALAHDFNAMAGQLERLFETSELFGAINNSVLSSLDAESIIETILTRLPSLVPGSNVSLVEFVTSETGAGHRHHEPGQPARPIAELATVTTRLHGFMSAQPDPWIEIGPRSRWIVEGLGLAEDPPQVIFPMMASGRLVGVLSIAGTLLDERSLRRVRRVADHCLIALENARLMMQFDRMSWGTLRTLARAVDAKSAWTAGHSERVARLARGVAEELGLGPQDQDRIYRGGLLHDVGKIGTPVEILDKPGPLTARETAVMREHVILGVKILEPIEEYSTLLPMVRSHHERWDGGGYPDGLQGTLIPLDARIVQVSDVYDAMTSDRPFRAGMVPARALRIILDGVHTQFDPDCAQALWLFLSRESELGPLQLEGEPTP